MAGEREPLPGRPLDKAPAVKHFVYLFNSCCFLDTLQQRLKFEKPTTDKREMQKKKKASKGLPPVRTLGVGEKVSRLTLEQERVGVSVAKSDGAVLVEQGGTVLPVLPSWWSAEF